MNGGAAGIPAFVLSPQYARALARARFARNDPFDRDPVKLREQIEACAESNFRLAAQGVISKETAKAWTLLSTLVQLELISLATEAGYGS